MPGGTVLPKKVRLLPEAWPVLLLALLAVGGFLLWHGPASLVYSVPAFVAVACLFLEASWRFLASPLALSAPVSGRVLQTSRVRDTWLQRDAWRVRLRPSRFFMGSLYSVTEGKCNEQWVRRHGGRSSHASWVRTDEGDDTLMVISSVWSLRFRLGLFHRPGDRVGQGQRIGYLCFNAIVEVYAPVTARCIVQAGQRLTAGAPLLYLVRHQPASILKEAP